MNNDRTTTANTVSSERQAGAPCPLGTRELLLPLMEPPGRATRKARQFEVQIGQLRSQGYSLDAIRRALARAGVHVSISTVRREAIRQACTAQSAATRPTAFPPPRVHQAQLSSAKACAPAPAIAPNPSALDLETSGKDQAEAFLRSQVTNPLLRAKEDP